MSLKDKFTDLLSEEETEKPTKEIKEKPKKETVEDSKEIDIDLKETWNKLKELSKKDYVYFLSLIPILVIALWIRLRNMDLLKGKYLLGLDPYYFYRLAKYIVENGHLMEVDYMRFVPVGNVLSFDLFPYFLAAWHKFASIFTGQPQIYSHIIYPPIFTIIGFIFFFLFVRELWSNKVALVSTALFSVVPGYLYRTMAGFADHEVLAMVFLFASLWLFIKFWKEKSIKSKFTFAGLSGLLAALMALTWPAVAVITISLSIFITLEILFEKINKKYFVGFLIWTLLFTLPLIIFKGVSQLKDIKVIVIFFPLLVFIIYYLIKKLKFLKIKAPTGLISIIMSIILAIIGITLVFDFSFLMRYAVSPAGIQRVSATTSEIIGGVNLWGTFNWILIFGILGTLYLFYHSFKESKKELIVLEIFGFISLFMLLLAEKISHNLRLAGLGLILIVIVLLYIYTYYKKGKENTYILKSNFVMLFPLILFLVVAYVGKTAARFVFLFAPFICLMAGYFLISATKELYKRKNLRILSLIFIIIIFVLFFANASNSAMTAERTGSHLPGQWNDAMTWLRENTPEDSVISHWWDYGYWTQSVAERPSTEDGAKGNSYWIYTLARYGMVAHNDTKALEYFKTHEVDYLLYSGEEIGKYHAFSYLASRETKPNHYDRESTIGTFVMAQEKEVRNGTLLVYQGGWPLDKNIVLNNLVLPEGKAALGAITIKTDKNNRLLEAPQAIIVYNNQQYSDKINCVYSNGEKQEFDVNSSIGGCIKFVPYFQNAQQVVQNGGLFYMSPKVYPGLFARLYILNQNITGYEEVYADQNPLGIYRGRVIGPIKIWKVDYPENITKDESLLEAPEDFEEWYGY